jgi:hypothetical protein
MIKACRKAKTNQHIDKLLIQLLLEKELVNICIGNDWNGVKFYSHKAASTMKAIRKMNNILKKL